MSAVDLILHLPFDSVDAPADMDRSAQRRPVTLTGAPVVERDPVIGAATRFSGGDGIDVLLAGLGGNNPRTTVSAWIRMDALPAYRAWILLLGEPKLGAQHWLVGADGETSIGVWSGPQATPKMPANAWRHWAVVHDGTAFTCLLDGKPLGVPVAGTFDFGRTTLRIGLPPSILQEDGFVGAIAHLRVHARDLSTDEIKAIMVADRTPRAAWQLDNPLDCRILDAADTPTAVIKDNPLGETLALELNNVSTRPLSLNGSNPRRSVMTLTFRPGTLAAQVLVAKGPLSLRDSPDWDMLRPKKAADGSVAVTIRYRGAGRQLQPGESIVVTLDNVVAEPGEGARVTLVGFAYEGFAFADGSGELVAGSRVKALHVVSHTGRPKAPLALAFRDRGAILPGAQYINVIQLAIANNSSDRTLRFVPPSQTPNPRRGTELSLSVDAELDGESRPTALCRVSEVEAIAVTAPDGWILRKEGMDSASPSWVLTPTRAIDLEPGEQLDVELRDITSTNGLGGAPIRLGHRGLPGFWDGEQALSIDKSPIQIDLHGRVGIGDAAASIWPLSIRAAGDGDEWMSLADHDGKTMWHLNQYTGAGLNFVETHVLDGRLFLKNGGRGVGIGLTDPAADTDLHVGSDKATAVVVETRGTSADRPKVELRASNGQITGALSLEGSDVVLSAKPGGVKIHAADYDRMGCDEKGAWFGAVPATRRDEVRTTQVVYGTTVHRGDVWSKGALFFDDGRVERSSLSDKSSPRNFIQADVLQISSFHRNLSPHYLNGNDFLHIAAERNGMLTILDSGDAPYTSLIWHTSGVHVQGNLNVSGTLTATSKQFATTHPVRPEAQLVHACLEAPENAVTYRGEAALAAGRAVVELPHYFEALTRPGGRTVHLTAKGREPFLLSYEDVEHGRFTVHGTKPDGRFSWEVRAVRADVAPLEAEPDGATDGERLRAS